MRFVLCFLGLLLLATPMRAEDLLATLRPGHPRLIATAQTWEDFAQRRKQEPPFDAMLKQLEAAGRKELGKPVLERTLIGRRMLAVSRQAMKRISLWSFNYRLTGDKVFLERAEKEMLAVSAFKDWNPTHFLDVAEMTSAVAIGYDWLYDVLQPSTLAAVRKAIVEKALTIGSDPTDPRTKLFYHAQGNWNQVCFGGLTLGALAIAEEEPDLARRTLEQVKANNIYGQKQYAPDGVYIEGPSYWGYGTTYEVILISALRSALGTDWDLAKAPGFLESSDYMLQIAGPSRSYFNYSDGGQKVAYNSAMHWFARERQRPDLLYGQPALSPEDDVPFGPEMMIWSDSFAPAPVPALPLAWRGNGVQPLAVFRSSWGDPSALYFALKGGSASLNHGHMDAGTFVLDADGVRWADDLGMQDYESIESKGIKLFSSGQDAPRWTVFRLTNFAHNTLTIDGKLHRWNGAAKIIGFAGDPATGVGKAVLDLSPVFAGQAAKVTRGFQVMADKSVLVQDELSGLQPGARVRWAMVTGAAVAPHGREATLKQAGKTLQAAVEAQPAAEFSVTSADPPKNNYDAPNPGKRILKAEVTAPASGQVTIRVLLRPGVKAVKVFPPLTACESWVPAEAASAQP